MCKCLRKLERETGFEPATLALARRCSTTELFPRPSEEAGFYRPDVKTVKPEIANILHAAVDHLLIRIHDAFEAVRCTDCPSATAVLVFRLRRVCFFCPLDGLERLEYSECNVAFRDSYQ